MAQEAGRLVKKDDKITKSLEVESYSWLQFNEQSHLYPDNARKSLIQVEYHDPVDLERKVKKPEKFFDKLAAKSQPLLAVDLQKDYVFSQREMLIKKRRRMLDEEEAIAEELAELVLEEEQMSLANKWAEEETQSLTQTESGNEFHMQAATSDVQTEVFEEKKQALVDEAELHRIREEAYALGLEEGRKEGFNLGQSAGHAEGFQAGQQEGQRVGFDTGYLEGEDKGHLAAESKTNVFFQKLLESVLEVDNLRTEVLAAGREIFIEITKIASEKLLRSQIAYDDATLKKFYTQALDEYRDRELVTFEMNPDDAKKFKEHIQAQADLPKIKIKENAELQSGDFKMEVDAELAVNDLKKSVEALIKDVSQQIFSNSPIGSGKKVG